MKDFCIKVPVLKLPPGGIFSCSQSDEKVEPIQEIDDFTPFWETDEPEEEKDISSDQTGVESDQGGFDLYSKSAKHLTGLPRPSLTECNTELSMIDKDGHKKEQTPSYPLTKTIF